MDSVEKILTTLDKSKPVLLVDADEVLLRFVERLEQYFLSQGFELRLISFQLTGNIYNMNTGDPAEPAEVKGLLANFFEECVDDMASVPGAAEGLASLSEHYQIAILTNVPQSSKARRARNLALQGMDYPVIANKGDKGPAVKLIAAATEKTTVFIDDLPPQHSSVANHCPGSHRIHFVADSRLARMISKAPDANIRIDKWDQVTHHLTTLLEI